MNWAPHAPIQGRLAWRQARPTRTVVLEQKGTLKGSTSIRLSKVCGARSWFITTQCKNQVILLCL